MQFKFKGLDKLRKRLAKNVDMDAVKNVVKKHGAEMQQNAMRQAPVDTGNLKRSIGIEILDSGMTALVMPTAEYAPYVEFGTRFNYAIPFMRTSFDSQVKKFEAALKRLVR